MIINSVLTKERTAQILADAKARVDKIISDRTPEPPTPEYLERLHKAEEELAVIAAAKTEAERLALLDAAINKKHSYRAKSQSGKVHEFEHMPYLTHLVVINQDKPDQHYNYCDSRKIAELVKKNVLMSKQEHLKLAERSRKHGTPDQLKRAEMHDKLAAEAAGKTAEIMEMNVVKKAQ